MSPALEDREPDEEIVRLIRSGQEEGFCRLMEEYAPRVKGALRKMTTFDSSRDAQIEDATVDALLAFCLHIDGFGEPRGSLFGWLFVVARNNFISKLREEMARPVLQIVDPQLLDGRRARNSVPEPKSLRQARLLEQLSICIAKLSDMQQDIVLADLDPDSSVSEVEIAQKWNTSENCIRVSRTKAHRRLRRLMRRSRR